MSGRLLSRGSRAAWRTQVLRFFMAFFNAMSDLRPDLLTLPCQIASECPKKVCCDILGIFTHLTLTQLTPLGVVTLMQNTPRNPSITLTVLYPLQDHSACVIFLFGLCFKNKRALINYTISSSLNVDNVQVSSYKKFDANCYSQMLLLLKMSNRRMFIPNDHRVRLPFDQRNPKSAHR